MFRDFALFRPSLTRRRTSLLGRVATFAGLARQRRHLGQLDAHLLKDVGISRDDARIEAARPFWDAPSHWKL